MYVVPSVLWRCWLGGRKGIRPVKNWVVGCWRGYSVWSEVQTCIWPSRCHCHSLSLASVKSRLVLPFWYRPTRVVLEIVPLNARARVCVCVCVCVCVYVCPVFISTLNLSLYISSFLPFLCLCCPSYSPPKALCFRPVRLYIRACPGEAFSDLLVVDLWFSIYRVNYDMLLEMLF